MKNPLTLESLNNTLGFSCIENHFIGLLRHNKLPYQVLFSRSFVPINETISSFKESEQKYEYYDGIERVHLFSKELDLAQVDYVQNVPFEKLEPMLERSYAAEMPLLIKVDHESMLDDKSILPWRNDHYVSLFNFQKEERKVTLLDDNPRRMVCMEIDQIKAFYGGEVQVISILDRVDWDNYFLEITGILEDVLYSINSITEAQSNFQLTSEDIVSFRDSIGVLRISRRRFISWIDWLEEKKVLSNMEPVREEFQKLIKLLDKLYMMAEITRLKNGVDFSPMMRLLSEVKLQEKSWAEKLSSVQLLPVGENK